MSESDSPQTVEMPQPVAWAVEFPGDDEPFFLAFREARAIDEAGGGGKVVPLYRSPTLTDAEREAIGVAACICEDAGHTDIAVIVNAALDRLTIPPLERTQPSGHPG